jgi:hypothetical protein
MRPPAGAGLPSGPERRALAACFAQGGLRWRRLWSLPADVAASSDHSASCPTVIGSSSSRRTSAWPNPLLGSTQAQLPRLLRARLTAPGGAASPPGGGLTSRGRGRPTGRPDIASGARASRLQSRRLRCPSTIQAAAALQRLPRHSATGAQGAGGRARAEILRSAQGALRPHAHLRGCAHRAGRGCNP